MGGPSNDMQGGVGVNNLFTDPMANAAMMYGSSLANQGKDMVNKEVRKIMISIGLFLISYMKNNTNPANNK